MVLAISLVFALIFAFVLAGILRWRRLGLFRHRSLRRRGRHYCLYLRCGLLLLAAVLLGHWLGLNRIALSLRLGLFLCGAMLFLHGLWRHCVALNLRPGSLLHDRLLLWHCPGLRRVVLKIRRRPHVPWLWTLRSDRGRRHGLLVALRHGIPGSPLVDWCLTLRT